jgi:hypothetical protein
MTEEISAVSSTEYEKELHALARMVTHARHSAQDLGATMPTYCLDVALAAIIEELEMHGLDLPKGEMKAAPGIPAYYN